MLPGVTVKRVDQPAGTQQDGMSTATPEQVLEAIVTGINSGNLESLMPLYESEAAFATQPGSLAHGAAGVGEALTGFISMNGELELEVTRVLEVGDLALVMGVWSFTGTGPEGEPVRLAARNADVLRRQSDGTWRFVIDNPWGTA
jgi:ketosteroid isomerase-like protein